MKPTQPLMSFLIRSLIAEPDQIERHGPCYLLMGRHIGHEL